MFACPAVLLCGADWETAKRTREMGNSQPYITQAHVKIPFEEPSTVQTILSGGENVSDLKDFRLAQEFIQNHVVTEDASQISQSFLRYDRKDPG